MPPPGSDPARTAHCHELGDRITAAIRALPPSQREVFLLRQESNLPFREIARLQGVTLNTALARMHYAVQKLQTALWEDYASLGGTP